ncbi:MAG: DUF1634 domain-containing protein [Betaproteobacteria bacterium]
MTERDAAAGPPPEQLRYAALLDRGARLGLFVAVVCFAAYAVEILPAGVPFADVPALLKLPLADYLAATGRPTGWGWLRLAGDGEFSSLVGIAILAGCSLLPLAVAIPLYAKRGSRVHAIICVVEIGILLLAASGVLTAGH